MLLRQIGTATPWGCACEGRGINEPHYRQIPRSGEGGRAAALRSHIPSSLQDDRNSLFTAGAINYGIDFLLVKNRTSDKFFPMFPWLFPVQSGLPQFQNPEPAALQEAGASRGRDAAAIQGYRGW